MCLCVCRGPADKGCTVVKVVTNVGRVFTFISEKEGIIKQN